MTPTEAQTRQQIIDAQLAQAGWGVKDRNLLAEYLHRIAEDGADTVGFSDYALLGKSEQPIGLVEVKRSSRDELAGKRQAAGYADDILRRFGQDPFIFLANGKTIQFWDRERYPPRRVSGFFSREDLERLLHQRQYAQPLNRMEINHAIAGRDYQIEAIRRVAEAIDQARRYFLLVMATGTGKTRTVIALIDLLLRAKRAQRILFLADRRELVRQAMGAIREHLPNESVARLEAGELAPGARIHVATYASMMQVYSQFSVGHYDLIVADESHRSIYNRYQAIFDRFDALQLGLTATPTDFIDHNTFQLFGCEDGVPTFNYPLEQAVSDGYLVAHRVLQTQTSFQVRGIHGSQVPLAAEPQVREQLAKQGIDIEELDFAGTDLEKTVTNTGTNQSLAREFMEKCRKDVLGLPHKAIIFAVSHAHAKRLYEAFNALYPDYQRRGMAEIIDSHMERAELTLDDFKHRDMPRVAISVDMLDTGIDVPPIQTLMFAKPVFSRVKFWQMIGRGTRLYADPLTGARKKDFLIIDCWNNFDYFQLNPEGEPDHPSEPLPVRLFRLRLERRALQVARRLDDQRIIADLRAQLARLPQDNINIQPHLDELRRLQHTWPEPAEASDRHLSQTIAPLMRYDWTEALVEIQFRVLAERLTCAWLAVRDDEVARLAERVRESIANLAGTVREVAAVAEQRAWVRSPGFWAHLDLERLQTLQDTFAPLMRFRQSQRPDIIELDLPDQISTRRWIIYGPAGEGAFADGYRERVEAGVRRLAETQPALIKLQRGDAPDGEDLAALTRALNQSDLFVTEEVLRELYEQPAANLADFMRHILELRHLPSWEERIRAAFEQFIQDHGGLSASQINFLRAIRAAVLQHARLTRDQLARPPLARAGRVEALFKPAEIDEILDFANRLVDAA